MSVPDSRSSVKAASRELRLLALGSAAPTLWFLGLVVLYAVCARDCRAFVTTLGWSILALCLAGSGASLASLLRMMRGDAAQQVAQPALDRFMSWGGVALNLLSLLLLGGFGIPLLLLRPCE
jgi:hypothetical protein